MNRAGGASRASGTLAVLMLAFGAVAEAAEWSDWQVGGRYQAFWTENISKTAFPAAERSETIQELRLELGRSLQLSDSARLNLGADLRHLSHRRFGALDRTDPGLNLGLRNKSGLGLRAWWQELRFSHHEISPDDALREGHQQQWTLAFGKRFSERFDGLVSLARLNREGGSGLVRPTDPTRPTNVFDQSADQFRLQWNSLLSADWLLAASWTEQRGDFDSQCPTANVTQVVADENPAALSRDLRVFGGCVYRLKGEIRFVDLELVWNISQQLGASLLIRHQEGSGWVLEYDNKAAQLEISYQF